MWASELVSNPKITISLKITTDLMSYWWYKLSGHLGKSDRIIWFSVGRSHTEFVFSHIITKSNKQRYKDVKWPVQHYF